MPKLAEFVAKSGALRPSNEGFSAFEQAGRRVGYMYRGAGVAQAKTAATNAQVLADKAQWPFTLFALQQKLNPPPAAKGTNFRVLPGGGFDQYPGAGGQVSGSTYAAIVAANAADNPPTYNPLAYGGGGLARQAAGLTDQLGSLIGVGSYTPSGPGISPNAAAEAAAQDWANANPGGNPNPGVGVTPDTITVGSEGQSAFDSGGGGGIYNGTYGTWSGSGSSDVSTP